MSGGFVIAVDGPAASGKGTVASRLGGLYKLPVLDTGLLYRAVGVILQRAGGDLDDSESAAQVAAKLSPVMLADPAFRTRAAGEAASRVAVHPQVREALLAFQRDFAAQPGGAVLDGRDIGTVICPEADVKLFIEADSKARMERRARQLEKNGQVVDRYALFHQIEERDRRDMGNPHGGFYKADDAHLLDTTLLDIEAALRAAIAIVDRTMALKAGS